MRFYFVSIQSATNMDKLEVIKKGLKNGDYTKLVIATGKSYATIKKVLDGTRNNEMVVKAAEALAEKNKREEEAMLKKLSETEAPTQN